MAHSQIIMNWIAEFSDRRKEPRVRYDMLRVDLCGETHSPVDWSHGGFRLDPAPYHHHPGVVANGAFCFAGSDYFGSFMAVVRWRKGDAAGYEFIDPAEVLKTPLWE